MYENVMKKFDEMGADVQFRPSRNIVSIAIDIANIKGSEVFDIAINPDIRDNLDLQVLQVLPRDRHLVLFARHFDQPDRGDEKFHFLCGHDERHWFVAGVNGVSTVAGAKTALKPREVVWRENRASLRSKLRERRKNEVSVRQGEWFFLPEQMIVPANLVLRREPLRRTGVRMGKPHWAEFAFRIGGERVMVCDRYANGVTIAQYDKLIARDPSLAKLNWTERRRNAAMFVKGRISHPDHATVVLRNWHRVMMNTEVSTDLVTFLD